MRRRRSEAQQLQLQKKFIFYALNRVGQNFQQFVQENLRSEIEYVYNFCLKILVVWLREISCLVEKESVCFFSFSMWELMNSTLKNTHGEGERLHIKRKIYLF